MPKLGESVTEGTLGAWLKQVGDRVDKYEPMVEVVTDKVTAEIPAPVAGTIVEIIGQEGETIPVGGVICLIDEGGTPGATIAPTAVDVTPQTPAERTTQAIEATPTLASTPVDSGGADFDEQAARDARDEAELLKHRSSPLVRRLAAEHGIDLGGIAGSGIGGRVTKQDVMQIIQSGARLRPAAAMPEPARPVTVPAAPAPEPAAPTIQPPMPAPAYAPPMTAQTGARPVELMPGDEVIDASVMRKQIAEHMVRSVQTAPHVTVWMEADMSNIVAARNRYKEEFQQREGFELTYLPFIARVVIQALREHPNINAAWDNGKIIRRKAINLGIAVALEDGLIVPVIKQADERNIVGIARAVSDLATRARANKLTPDDISGGTFTLNNPGTLGSLFSTPIIVQPQAAILSMEAIVKRPVVVDDAIAIRPMMNLSLSLDHRILDGLSGTRFLAAVKRGLEGFPTDSSIW
jgi:2-oxoisovalerate dehydrogenase E2 component (dihydrolipoyl transacylase)